MTPPHFDLGEDGPWEKMADILIPIKYSKGTEIHVYLPVKSWITLPNSPRRMLKNPSSCEADQIPPGSVPLQVKPVGKRCDPP